MRGARVRYQESHDPGTDQPEKRHDDMERETL